MFRKNQKRILINSKHFSHKTKTNKQKKKKQKKRKNKSIELTAEYEMLLMREV